MNLVALIDKFVAFIDPGSGVFRRLESAPWIDALETKLPRRLPASFRSLVTRCYIQFARPEGGSYDPICFDARRSVSNRGFPIVWLDHEDILCRERIRSVATVSDSFYRFVADLVRRA